jgi:hypothetical protein
MNMNKSSTISIEDKTKTPGTTARRALLLLLLLLLLR